MTTQITTHTAEHLKLLVDAGYNVFWKTRAYKVIKDSIGQYLIVCTINNDCIGLTWTDGVTVNGQPGDFFLG